MGVTCKCYAAGALSAPNPIVGAGFVSRGTRFISPSRAVAGFLHSSTTDAFLSLPLEIRTHFMQDIA